MTVLPLSDDFTLTLPSSAMRPLSLSAGDRLVACAVDGRLVLVLIQATGAARGFLPGLSTSIEAEPAPDK